MRVCRIHFRYYTTLLEERKLRLAPADQLIIRHAGSGLQWVGTQRPNQPLEIFLTLDLPEFFLGLAQALTDTQAFCFIRVIDIIEELLQTGSVAIP